MDEIIQSSNWDTQSDAMHNAHCYTLRQLQRCEGRACGVPLQRVHSQKYRYWAQAFVSHNNLWTCDGHDKVHNFGAPRGRKQYQYIAVPCVN